MMRSAPDAIEVATSLFVAVFNLAIALGSLLGGQAIDRLDLATSVLLAGVLTTMALGLALVTRTYPAHDIL
ncbi:putative arabinose transporter [compost metagenome]